MLTVKERLLVMKQSKSNDVRMSFFSFLSKNLAVSQVKDDGAIYP